MAEGSSHWRAMLQPLFDSFVATQLHDRCSSTDPRFHISVVVHFVSKTASLKMFFLLRSLWLLFSVRLSNSLDIVIVFFHALEIIPFNITQHRHTKKRSPCHSALTDSFPFDDNNGNDDDDKARVSMLQNLFNQNRLK